MEEKERDLGNGSTSEGPVFRIVNIIVGKNIKLLTIRIFIIYEGIFL